MAECRLYLPSPPSVAEIRARTSELATALAAGPVACLEIGLDCDDERAWREAIGLWREPAQDRGVAVLLHRWPALAAATFCDGVRLDPGDDVPSARRLVGGDRSLGVHAGHSRHAAMLAGERDADFVGLDADEELVRWWAELMELPSVAFSAESPHQAARLARAGADFVAVTEAVWSVPDQASLRIAEHGRAVRSGHLGT